MTVNDAPLQDRRRLVVLDPGFEHLHAHHATVNAGIARAGAAAGREVLIVAGRRLTPDARRVCVLAGAQVTSFWRTPGYPPDADRLTTEEHERLAGLFAGEIEALVASGHVGAEDDLHLHTGYSFHLEGLARALARLAPVLRGRVVVSLMFHPGLYAGRADGEPEMLDAREHSRHRRALDTLAGNTAVDLRLATSCRAYQRAYGRLWTRGPVRVHPAIVLDGTPAARGAPRGRRQRVLLYLGGPKENKGLSFSAQVGALAAPHCPDLEFVFHFNAGFPGSGAFREAVARLRAAGQRHGNVSVLEQRLEGDAYRELVASCDAACLFYDPGEYRFKTSGVLWDLLAVPGLRWVVSSGTWLADELAELGLPREELRFGDAEAAVKAIKALQAAASPATPRADDGYLQLLRRPYGEWLLEQTARPPATMPAPRGVLPRVPRHAVGAAARRRRILVVRTGYGHFSPLSGPGGFVQPLRDMGHEVDEWLVPLGHQSAWDLRPGGLGETMLRRCQGRIRSYQGNAMPYETRLQGMLGDYDVVHFVDGEHAGLLTALARLNGLQGPRLVATFHQPSAICADLVRQPDFLAGFDRLHLMAPDQRDFFSAHVDESRLRIVPHGLAPELLDFGSAPLDAPADVELEEALAHLGERSVILCVGGWLRDYPAFVATADLMRERTDCVFVAVSKGLSLDAAGRPNLVVLDRGVSDETLHALYRRASLLLLPLSAAAANNAILESLAHGLPIVTTDLPATRFYTRGLAEYCAHRPAEYAQGADRLLRRLADRHAGAEAAARSRAVAAELCWPNVAERMSAELYEA